MRKSLLSVEVRKSRAKKHPQWAKGAGREGWCLIVLGPKVGMEKQRLNQSPDGGYKEAEKRNLRTRSLCSKRVHKSFSTD